MAVLMGPAIYVVFELADVEEETVGRIAAVSRRLTAIETKLDLVLDALNLQATTVIEVETVPIGATHRCLESTASPHSSRRGGRRSRPPPCRNSVTLALRTGYTPVR